MSKNLSRNQCRAQEREHSPSRRLTRRAWIVSAIGVAVLGLTVKGGWRARAATRDLSTVTVYKSPTCACCEKWIRHMRESGFTVAEQNETDMSAVKRERGVPNGLISCHTSVIDGYVFEGHVPADLVQQVLRERPAFAGLAVPGMPQSAPGMDLGRERYEVFSFTRSGDTATYAVRG